MQAHSRNRIIAQLILNFVNGEELLRSPKLGCFNAGKNPGVYRMGECLGPTAVLGITEEENSLAPSGIRNHDLRDRMKI